MAISNRSRFPAYPPDLDPRLQVFLEALRGAVEDVVLGDMSFDSLDIEGTLTVDVISEYTTAAGITIDSCLIKDGVVSDAGISESSVTQHNAALDHGTLAGIGDDDHSIYALLAGRSGGQTLVGGTAASEDLTLQSTAHATKGDIVCLDPLVIPEGKALRVAASTSYLQLVGDPNVSQGGNILLYGSTHDTLANDIFLRTGTTTRCQWDDSAGRWEFTGLVRFGDTVQVDRIDGLTTVQMGFNRDPTAGNIYDFGGTFTGTTGLTRGIRQSNVITANQNSENIVLQHINSTINTGSFTSLGLEGLRIEVTASGAAVIPSFKIHNIKNLGGVAGGVTNLYGLYVDSITGATNNYAIKTNAGLVDFGDEVNTTEFYKVDGTQVVSNQGAAVADATDAASVILRCNELIARCRAHGLIAS